MTTTLRPAGPEEEAPGGGRTRRYTICANGRPVGGVRVTARPRGSRAAGEISELEVSEGRRRGRGAVAVLAAEEVLRTWDCVWVDATVPEDAPGPLRLAAALGYVERRRAMAKRLPRHPPALPEGVTARRIGPEEFPEWVAHSQEGYVADLIGAGLSEEQARAKAATELPVLLPQGADSAATVLRRLYAPTPEGTAGPAVGSLWVGLDAGRLRGHPIAWVLDVEVAREYRGRGHGRALMLLAERECVLAGRRDLGLTVSCSNLPAVRLYTSLGYRVTGRVMGKSLL